MLNRILVAAVGVPILVWLVLFAPTAALTAALALLAGLGGYELHKCVTGEKGGFLSVVSLIYPTAFVLTGTYLTKTAITFLPFFCVVVVFATAVLKGGRVRFAEIMSVCFGGTFIAWSFSAFLRIEALGLHRAYLLLPFILSFACDTFAYFAGRAFGRHKLAPKVSPNKTVEGSVGGILGNIVCGIIFALVMDRCLDAGISYWVMVLLALLCSIVAQLGDLSFSLIKREFGIKDYGKLFMEHGGVLDRFDSVLFVTPVVEFVLLAFLLTVRP